ncbi:hypothetical protein C4D60_Mb10t06620 [Musa balbisiana]|uniref:Uncharacterized protein n=1 Tax=Musa balbisiana TaxID=52838 RepID=A0A4S8IWI1_MUSBA|nr:hypothetical protein C4D60_Mb10t06620 [Musa balbisiana]
MAWFFRMASTISDSDRPKSLSGIPRYHLPDTGAIEALRSHEVKDGVGFLGGSESPVVSFDPDPSSHPASHWRMGRKHSKPRPIGCTVRFRPCIDIHKGKVKQIVGSTLRDSTDGGASDLVTNFESDKSPAEFANLYKKDGLKGGHVIMLGADAASQSAAFEALRAYPGGMQVGGGINADNAMNYLEEGASHVIVTSYIFSDGKMDPE